MDAIGSTVSITTYADALPTATRVDPTTKLLVLYDSSTSCTRKMAAIIAQGCAQIGGAVEVRLRCVPGSVNHWDKPGCRGEGGSDGVVATFADVGWADGIACGTPTNLGCVSWRMKKFWDDLSQSGLWAAIDGKVGVSFSSQGGDGGGGELVCMAMNHILLNFGFAVIGVTDYVSFKKTLHYGAVCAKVCVRARALSPPMSRRALRRLCNPKKLVRVTNLRTRAPLGVSLCGPPLCGLPAGAARRLGRHGVPPLGHALGRVHGVRGAGAARLPPAQGVQGERLGPLGLPGHPAARRRPQRARGPEPKAARPRGASSCDAQGPAQRRGRGHARAQKPSPANAGCRQGGRGGGRAGRGRYRRGPVVTQEKVKVELARPEAVNKKVPGSSFPKTQTST